MSHWAWCAFLGVSAIALVACGGDDSVPPADANETVSDASSVIAESSASGAGGAQASDDASAGASGAQPDGVDAPHDGPTGPNDATSEAEVALLEASDALAEGAMGDAETDVIEQAASDALSEGDVPLGSPTMTRICALTCSTSDDCRSDASISKGVCDTLSHRCVSCVDDLPCISGASGWSKSCTVDTECTTLFGDYCVDVGGFGVCAFDQAKIGTLNCPSNAVSYVIAKHGDAGTVNVCAKLTNTCDLLRGRCEGPCTITCTGDGSTCTSTCTPSRGGKICNASTKRCECASNTDCASPTSVCNLATKQCECASGADCAGDAASALACQ